MTQDHGRGLLPPQLKNIPLDPESQMSHHILWSGFQSSDLPEQLSKIDIDSPRFMELVIPKLEDWSRTWPLTLFLTLEELKIGFLSRKKLFPLGFLA